MNLIDNVICYMNVGGYVMFVIDMKNNGFIFEV